MALNRSHVAALGAALLLSSCSFATDALWPSLTGEDPSQAAQSEAAQAPQSGDRAMAAPTLGTGASASPPLLGTTRFVPPPVTAAQPTGTFVGQKVSQLRSELGILQTNVRQRNDNLQEIRRATTQNSQRYHGTVAAVNARLQLGTTPGNPVLVSQWNTAQSELDRIGLDIAAMNSLANSVAADSAMVSYLLETTRATYGLQGAIDEDHRQLAILEDETNRTLVLIDRLLNELSEDISRQTAYVGNERRSLTAISLAIKNGEYYGQSLTSRAYLSAAPLTSAAPASGSGGFAATNRRPLVVIRFDRADVPYQQALYNAVSRALERRPQAAFELVAVTPSQGTPAENALNASKAKRHADDVLRTLTEMGLPANRVNLSSTTSAEAATNEVHIYVQ
ncbi:MAG: hypothetical protein CL569_09125 [Alphaproteobacteria bacterium]|nr:hypothetical protein [Alphaproteobacteria bacterium]|tara:strand:- start:1019 stop:2200 length:1182 start_codon:yes stop_codon:yes gene_type:complete